MWFSRPKLTDEETGKELTGLAQTLPPLRATCVFISLTALSWRIHGVFIHDLDKSIDDVNVMTGEKDSDHE